MRDVSANGTHIRAFQVQFGQLIQLVKTQRAVDGEFIRADFAKLFFFEIELVLDIADQFFEHVFQSYDSNSSSEFIDHERQMGVLTQEQFEQFLQRHHLGHWNQFAFDLKQIRILRAHQRKQLLNVNQADGVIEVLTTERKARMT